MFVCVLFICVFAYVRARVWIYVCALFCVTKRVAMNKNACMCLLAGREPAEELLYRLRVLKDRDSFLKIVDSLGLGPIDFAEHVRKHIRVGAYARVRAALERCVVGSKEETEERYWLTVEKNTDRGSCSRYALVKDLFLSVATI